MCYEGICTVKLNFSMAMFCFYWVLIGHEWKKALAKGSQFFWMGGNYIFCSAIKLACVQLPAPLQKNLGEGCLCSGVLDCFLIFFCIN